jgi:hypothetical protein
MLISLLAIPLSIGTKVFAENDPVEYWAVIVGVQDYQYLDASPSFIPLPWESYDLEYADDDAEDLYSVLAPLFGTEHIKLLSNYRATKYGIRNAIEIWLDTKEDSNDVVLFYFAGHGDKFGAHSYISPYDMLSTSYTNDISDSTLASWLDCLESDKQIIVLDACKSGGFIQTLNKNGRMVVTSCATNEDAWEITDYENSLFTYHFLQAFEDLEGLMNGQSGTVSFYDIFNYGRTKTRLDSILDADESQTPQISNNIPQSIGLFETVEFQITNSGVPSDTRGTFIEIDNEKYSWSELPIRLVWMEYSSHTINITPAVSNGANKYEFQNWNDESTSQIRQLTAIDNISLASTYKKTSLPSFLIWPWLIAFLAIGISIAIWKPLKKRRSATKKAYARAWAHTMSSTPSEKTRDAQSVYYELTISKTEAISGTIKYLVRNNHKLAITVPQGVKHGTNVRLKNAKLKTDNEAGDIFITVQIKRE